MKRSVDFVIEHKGEPLGHKPSKALIAHRALFRPFRDASHDGVDCKPKTVGDARILTLVTIPSLAVLARR
jgi:hypothetical protein